MMGFEKVYTTTCGWLAALAVVLVCAAHPAAAQDAYSTYERALVHFENDDIEDSLFELKEALRTDANLLPGYILLARIYLKLGEGAAAQESLRKTRLLGADPVILEPLLAESLLQQRKHKELSSRKIAETLPPEVRSELLVAQSKAQIELGDMADAKGSLDEAVSLAPSAVAPRVTLATLALRNGDPQTASMRAIAVLRIAPDDPDAWYVSGSVKHTLGDLGGAVEAYDRALRIDDSHYDARVSRAGALLDQRRYDGASKDIVYLRESYPLDPRAAYLDSVLQAQQGHSRPARVALLQAVALLEELPGDVLRHSSQLQLIAGIAYFELEAFEQAQTHLGRYMERHPNEAGPRKIVGSILVSQGRTDQAIQMLEPALRVAPNDFQVLALLGTAYMQKGRHDLAIPYLENAVRGSGGSTDLRLRLARSRIAHGFDEQGLRELAAVFDENPKQNSEAGVTLTVALLKAGRPVAALEVAQRVVEVMPDDLTALNLLASSQAASGRSEAAERSYRRILLVDPEHMPAGINLAKLEASRGEFEVAKARLESMLERRPDSVLTMVELARVEERAGRLASALRWMQKAKGAAPRNIPAALGLVDLHLRLGEPALAMEAVSDAEAWAAEDLRVLAALGRIHMAVDRVDLANGVYQRMARIAGFDAGELFRIARLQLASGAGKDAIYTLNKALKGDSSHQAARELLVEAELAYGDGNRALELAQRLLNEHPERAISHRLVGDAAARLQRHEEAIARYQRALELAPSTAYLLALYRAQQRAGHLDEGRTLLLDWVEQHPGDGLSRLALAESYLGAGDLAKARSHYELVLAIAPDSPQVLNNLAYILDRQGESGAIEMARRAHLAAPKDPAISDTLGWLLVRHGEPDEGLRYLRDAQSRASASPEISYHIGAALAALERHGEARRALRRAIASNADFEGAEQAQKLLREIGG